MKHIVDLEWDGNGQVKATEKPSGDITNYPLKKGDKPHGSVVIWEYPVKDPPLGLYRRVFNTRRKGLHIARFGKCRRCYT